MDYLPKDATIEQASNWLQAKTGQTWILPRLLECHLTPHFWLDYKSGYPAIYGDQIEGYQTHMMFQGDLCRLESDGSDALVNMFAAHDGSLIKTEPGLLVPLSELRFKRDRVERVAEIINNTAPAQNSATHAPLMTLEAQRGYVLTLPYGQTHVQFGELAHLIADAIWPDAGADDSRTSYGLSRASLDGELIQAVEAGTLQVKDPLTFGPHTFPVGNALLSALVAVDDLRECVATRGLTVETAQPQATTPSPAHVVTDQTKSLEPASDGPAKSRLNKSEKTLIFEAKVLELTGKFWNDRTPGTEPTKSDLCKLVYDEILRTPIRGARKMTRSMVIDAAKPWRMPIVLPAMVPHSKFNDKRHPFKGER